MLLATNMKSASHQTHLLTNSRSLKLDWNMQPLSSFDNFPGFQTARANFDAFASTIDLRADSLQVRIKAAAGPVIRVGNIVAELRAFAAKFTTISHNYLQNSPKALGLLVND
jgi:hypothetical protein